MVFLRRGEATVEDGRDEVRAHLPSTNPYSFIPSSFPKYSKSCPKQAKKKRDKEEGEKKGKQTTKKTEEKEGQDVSNSGSRQGRTLC